MIIKCKMCGGNIQFSPGDTYGTCDSCGCLSTIPKTDNDQKLNRYNRANQLRIQFDFEKAIDAYERILEENNSDAEAHWNIVLCRYGIEYVDDPVTHHRIPTCHRMQIQSILSDEDYLSALENAPDSTSKKLYETQAKEIAEIQKYILEISQNETPYDIFICYKEKDEFEKRTLDSVIAQDIYSTLIDEGYKVFFSRITLEKRLGEKFEPYIFAALNSARVMLVVGTKPEYFNAVWVKNEWDRFLALMKTDRKRLLIPCYKNMDPKFLPEKLRIFQSQDLNKIGYMQDLLYGIQKVLGTKKDNHLSTQSYQVNEQNSSNISSLLDRAFFALEDGDWNQADRFCEQVLNINARNSSAYIGKLCAELKVRKPEDLSQHTIPLTEYNNYQKAVRFANVTQKAQLAEWNQTILAKIEFNKKATLRENALKILETSTSIEQVREAQRILKPISTFDGVDKLLDTCDQKIDFFQKKDYDYAIELMSKKGWTKAKELFRALGSYKDSKEQEKICDLSINEKLYQQAKQYQTNKQWQNAIACYEQLCNYKDSKLLLENCKILLQVEHDANHRNGKRKKSYGAKKKGININIIIIAALFVIVFIIGVIGYSSSNRRINPFITVTEPGNIITSLTPYPTINGTLKAASPSEDNENNKTDTEANGALHSSASPRAWLLITVDDKTYAPYPLTKTGDYTINQKKKNAKNVIHVTEDSIQMASSTCDNQLCVTEGVVTLENKASRVLGNYIICLPNGVTLELLNAEEYAALQSGKKQP